MFHSTLLIPVILVLRAYADAIQLTPSYEYGPGPGHLHGHPSLGYNGEDIAIHKPPGLGQPLGQGYGFGGVGGPLGHGYGVGFKGQGLGYGNVEGWGYGQHLGHGFYPGGVGVGHGVGYAGYAPGVLSPAPYALGGHSATTFNSAQNTLADQHHSSSSGLRGISSDHGDTSFRSGQVASKNLRGETVAFKDLDEAKNAHHEGKTFEGGHHFDQEGKHSDENVLNENHKKGHNVKSFKKSHHLDETGRTEEFYDEDHGEGGNYAFGGKKGGFGESGAQGFRGGFSDGKLALGGHQKEGRFGKEYAVDEVEGGQGKLEGGKFARDEHHYGFDRGVGEHGLGGHHQTSGFFKKFPQYY